METSLARNTNFRRLLIGRLVTNAGDSLYLIATMWLVYDLSGSTTATGVAGFLVMGPQMLQFLFGPLVDRYSIRGLLVASQAVQGVVVLTIPLATWLGHLSVPLLLVVIPVLALINQVVYPAQSALLPRIVDRTELASANSLMAMAFTGVDMAFNALGGVLIATIGAISLFVVDSVTFAVALFLFAGVKIPPAKSVGDDRPEDVAVDPGRPTERLVEPDPPIDDDPTGESESADNLSYFESLREGFALLRASTVLVALLLSVAISNFIFGGVFAILPAYADLRGGPTFYGALIAAIAAGQFVGALLAPRLQGIDFGRLTIVTMAAGGVLWYSAVAVPWLAGTLLLLFLAIVPGGIFNVGFQTMVQGAVSEQLLGRIAAILASVAGLATPIGALLGGVTATAVGTVPIMVGAAASLFVISLLFVAVPSLRRLPPSRDATPEDLALPPVA